MELVDHEIKVLRHIAKGDIADVPWGAALGQSLEVLTGNRLVERSFGVYSITSLGKAWLAEHGEPPEELLAGCLAVGVGGFHSDRYADPDDGQCQWCGLWRTP